MWCSRKKELKQQGDKEPPCWRTPLYCGNGQTDTRREESVKEGPMICAINHSTVGVNKYYSTMPDERRPARGKEK